MPPISPAPSQGLVLCTSNNAELVSNLHGNTPRHLARK